MLSLRAIRRSYIKSTKIIIHSLQFQLCHQNRIVDGIIVPVRSQRKEKSSEMHAHRIYRSVKRFHQPIKLLETCIMIWSSNYRILMFLPFGIYNSLLVSLFLIADGFIQLF